MQSMVEGACLRVGRAAAAPSGSHRSPPPPHSGGGTRRLSLIPLRGEAKAQRLPPGKALGVALGVNLVFLEGDVRQAVGAVLRLPPAGPCGPLGPFPPRPA